MKQSWKGRSLFYEIELIININLFFKLLQIESYRIKLVLSCLCIYVKDLLELLNIVCIFVFQGCYMMGKNFSQNLNLDLNIFLSYLR